MRKKNTTCVAIKTVPNCGGDKRKTKNVVLCTRSYSPLPFRDVFAFYVAEKNQATEWPPAHFSYEHSYPHILASFVLSTVLVFKGTFFTWVLDPAPLSYSGMLLKQFSFISSISANFFLSWVKPIKHSNMLIFLS